MTAYAAPDANLVANVNGPWSALDLVAGDADVSVDAPQARSSSPAETAFADSVPAASTAYVSGVTVVAGDGDVG